MERNINNFGIINWMGVGFCSCALLWSIADANLFNIIVNTFFLIINLTFAILIFKFDMQEVPKEWN